jgi:hypothetical protein
MATTHVPSRGSQPSSSVESTPGAREARLSRYFVGWVFVAPFVGFALAGRVFNLGAQGHWELWKAVVLGAVLMVPFAIGTYLGFRAVSKGSRGGWVGLLANLILGALAIGMPISESLRG